jgi:hypothetical protein
MDGHAANTDAVRHGNPCPTIFGSDAGTFSHSVADMWNE